MALPRSHSSHSKLSVSALFVLIVFAIAGLGCGSGTKSTGPSGGGGSGGGGTGGGTGGGGTGGGGTGGSGNNSSAQQFVYLTNGTPSITGFVLNIDGSLAAISGSPFAVGGTNLAALPNGKFVFSLGGTTPTNNAVNTGSIGPNGSLSISSTLADSVSGPVQINPDGGTLYVGSISASADNPGIRVYSIQSNGTLQFTNAVINQNARRFSFLSDGTYAYAAYCFHLAADIQGFNTANGALTTVTNNVPQPAAMGECPNTVALTPKGNMLAAAWSDADNVGPIDNLITLYSVSSSHALSMVGTSFPASGAGVDSVFDPSGIFFIVAQDNGIGVYRMGANSVTEVPQSPFAAGTNFSRVALSPSGNFALAISSAANQVFVFTLNSSTGALTMAPGSPQSVTSPMDIAVVEQ